MPISKTWNVLALGSYFVHDASFITAKKKKNLCLALLRFRSRIETSNETKCSKAIERSCEFFNSSVRPFNSELLATFPCLVANWLLFEMKLAFPRSKAISYPMR